MRVTVFGATGAIGRLVVQQLLDDGHQVTALVRTPAKLTLTHSQLTVVTGQLSDRDAVEQAVSGADAVISALGPSLKRSTTGTQVTDGTRTVVQVMEAQKVTRFIGLATPSLADPKDKPHWKHKVLPVAAGLMFPNALAELKGMTEAVTASEPRLHHRPHHQPHRQARHRPHPLRLPRPRQGRLRHEPRRHRRVPRLPAHRHPLPADHARHQQLTQDPSAMTFELGVYSFGNTPRLADGSRGPTAQAIRDVLEAVKLADEVGLDFFGVGEHHMRSMPLSSPTSVVNAAAAVHPPDQARHHGHRPVDRRPDPGVPAARHRRVPRSRTHRTGRRTRLVDDHVPAVRPRRARLRHAVRLQTRPADGHQRRRERHLARPAPPAAAGGRHRLPPPRGAAEDLAGHRRQPGLGAAAPSSRGCRCSSASSAALPSTGRSTGTPTATPGPRPAIPPSGRHRGRRARVRRRSGDPGPVDLPGVRAPHDGRGHGRDRPPRPLTRRPRRDLRPRRHGLRRRPRRDRRPHPPPARAARPLAPDPADGRRRDAATRLPAAPSNCSARKCSPRSAPNWRNHEPEPEPEAATPRMPPALSRSPPYGRIDAPPTRGEASAGPAICPTADHPPIRRTPCHRNRPRYPQGTRPAARSDRGVKTSATGLRTRAPPTPLTPQAPDARPQ